MASVRAWLVPLSGTRRDAHEINKDGLSIGRREGCGVCLDSPTISAVQCEIHHRRDGFELEDKSSNGTYINGFAMEKSCPVLLKEGDIIQLTKRWEENLALQFRFTLVPRPVSIDTGLDQGPAAKLASAVQEAAAPVPPDGLGPWERVTVVEWAEGLTAPSGVPASSSSAVLGTAAAARVARLQEKAASLTAELVEAKAALASAAPPSEPEEMVLGSRVAGEEAVLEAEHAELIAQRSFLEAEVAEKRAASERYVRALGGAEKSLEAARSNHRRLVEDLNLAVTTAVLEAGKLDAYNALFQECDVSAHSAAESLGPTCALAEGLQAQIDCERLVAGSARSDELRIIRRLEYRKESIVAIQGIAHGLVEDMRRKASMLADSIEVSGGLGQPTGSLDAVLDPQAAGASPIVSSSVPASSPSLAPTERVDLPWPKCEETMPSEWGRGAAEAAVPREPRLLRKPLAEARRTSLLIR